MNSRRESVLGILRKWAARFVAHSSFERVFLFGSLVYRDGALFEPSRSDIDIIAEFSHGHKTPAQRSTACQAALALKRELENSLAKLLERDPTGAPIVSAVVGTPFEIENGI